MPFSLLTVYFLLIENFIHAFNVFGPRHPQFLPPVLLLAASSPSPPSFIHPLLFFYLDTLSLCCVASIYMSIGPSIAARVASHGPHHQRKVSQQLSVASGSSARRGTSWSTAHPMPGFCLSGSRAGLAHAVSVTIRSYVQLPCCIQ